MRIQLVSPLPDEGFGYNQGIYWPVGLLTIGSFLKRELPDTRVEILDESILGPHAIVDRLGAPLIGIQASSCMTYRNVLRLARAAKETGAIVLLGGPFASEVPEQILRLRPFVDAVVTGAGEEPVREIVERLRQGAAKRDALRNVPGVWMRTGGTILPSRDVPTFDFEEALPLDYSLIPVEAYHRNYRARMDGQFVGSFQIFTHFGCKYRDLRQRAGKDWCSYCALSTAASVRDVDAVRREIIETFRSAGVPDGARVILKCYGDNASALGDHLHELAEALHSDAFLRRFDIRWSMYAQSSRVSPRVVEAFRKLKVHEVYVGFDSVDDEVQKLNGLGTSRTAHIRAARRLQDAGIRIHGGFVLGCAGESSVTLQATLDFAEELVALGNVDMYHASPLVVLPGSPAFRMLSEVEPSIKKTDFLDTRSLQLLWLKHFCPELGDPGSALHDLEEMAGKITALGRIPSSFGGWRERTGEHPCSEGEGEVIAVKQAR